MPTTTLPPPRAPGRLSAPKRSTGVGRKREEPDQSTYQGRFAARLNELLEARGLTPPEFAERCEAGKTTVYNWLAGRNVPMLDDWPKIAKVLRVSVADLLPPK